MGVGSGVTTGSGFLVDFFGMVFVSIGRVFVVVSVVVVLVVVAVVVSVAEMIVKGVSVRTLLASAMEDVT